MCQLFFVCRLECALVVYMFFDRILSLDYLASIRRHISVESILLGALQVESRCWL